MISEFLDRSKVLAETRAQRDWLAALQEKIKAKDKSTLAELRKHHITTREISRVIAALDDSLAAATADTTHPQGAAYIPSDPVICALQTGVSQIALDNGMLEVNVPPVSAKINRSARGVAAAGSDVVDTSPSLKLRRRPGKAAGGARGGAVRSPFVENEDPLYLLDGFRAKFGVLFKKSRPFNPNPARIASTVKPLSLFIFGDWGTGLELAARVTRRIGEQLAAMDGSRQAHVIHLGDVYYVGDSDEYVKRVLPYWPVSPADREKTGSWSLNGNHDMYSGGHGYFDTLLRDKTLIRWHGDEQGEPSSFFLIENDDWQIFGLDSSWNLPSLGSAVFGKPTLKDYSGQSGRLTREQVKWMGTMLNPAKGCILMTHHDPGNGKEGAEATVAMLEKAGIYQRIDAWFWGHKHRCTVFKPKELRKDPVLMKAPGFCACLGTGGVPVTEKNFKEEGASKDALWEEDRMDSKSPVYEGSKVIPFGFGRVDTESGKFTLRIYDHAGEERYACEVTRELPAAKTARRAGPKEKAAAVKSSVKISEIGKIRPDISPQAAAGPAAEGDWTILVYMAGDNNLDDFGADDIREMKKTGSSDKINIIVQRDTAAAGEPTCRYRVRKGTPLKDDVVEVLGETNTGDPKVLADFLEWGRVTYPAKRTMAVIWNHGSGWDDTDIYAEARRRGLNPPAARPTTGDGQRRGGVSGRLVLPGGFVRRSAAKKRFRGPFFMTAFKLEQRRAIAFDDDAQDFLDSVEMKNVFNAATRAAGRKFDVIGMDACLMSMIETCLQIRDAGEFFCGSQELEPGKGWPYDTILKALAAKTSMDGRELTEIIVREFVDSYPASEVVTQSAIELKELAEVVRSADELGELLSKAYVNHDFQMQGAITDARVRAQGYDHPDYVDLSDFCGRLAANAPACAALAGKVCDAVAACVVANRAPHQQVGASTGLSIYLPFGKVSPLYKNLDFAGGGWGNFLNSRTN